MQISVHREEQISLRLLLIEKEMSLQWNVSLLLLLSIRTVLPADTKTYKTYTTYTKTLNELNLQTTNNFPACVV